MFDRFELFLKDPVLAVCLIRGQYVHVIDGGIIHYSHILEYYRILFGRAKSRKRYTA